ncbi:MAG: hypothetical protein ACKOWQ_01245 [Aquirufa sp.]
MNTFQLDLGILQINLSDEKLFVNTFASNETFALRSVIGIGVVDLIDDYNKKLTNSNKKLLYGTLSLGLFILLLMNAGSGYNGFLGFIPNTLLLVSICFAIYNFVNYKKPILMSAVRIMVNGGNRYFEFDKAGVESEAIAEFVARVESTLTAYHKKD